MKNLFHQTKQAFYFSLAFYLLSIACMFFKVELAAVLWSTALLISLIWTVLVIREILLSRLLNSRERFLLTLFIIFFNILAGIPYFAFIRSKVIGEYNSKK